MVGTLQLIAILDLLLAGGVMIVYLAGKITVERKERKITLRRNA